MQGEAAIITGGPSDIGHAPGERLARRDARLTVADLNAPAAQPLAEEIRAADGQAIALDAAGILFASGAA